MLKISLRNYVAKVLFMATALMLGGGLCLWTVDGLYRDALIDRYYLPLKHLHTNFQTAASYGIDLVRNNGVERDLRRTEKVLDKQFAADEVSVNRTLTQPAMMLVSPDGRIVRRGSDQANTQLSGPLRDAWSIPNGSGESAKSIRHVRVDGGYAIPMKIKDAESNWLASLLLVIDDAAIDSRSSRLLNESLLIIAVFVVFAVLVYGLLLMLVLPQRPHPRAYRQRRVFWFTIVYAAVAQLTLTLAIGLVYDREFRTTSIEKSELLARVLQADVDAALARGVALADLDFRHYPWKQLADEFRILGSIDIVDQSDQLLGRVTRTDVEHYERDATSWQEFITTGFKDYAATTATLTQNGHTVGALRLRLSDEGLTAAWFDLIGDGLTANMVIVLLLVEAILLFGLYADPSTNGGRPTVGKYFGLMRPAIFLFIFGVDLSMSFVPLNMATFYEPVFGLSPNFVMGLPIAAEFLCVGIAILYAGVWVDRVGWRKPFLIGISLAAAAALYSWMASSMLHFVLSRAVLGVGIGFALLASQGFIISYGNDSTKARGLAQLFAALYGGSIGGSVTGAILAERLGFSTVFLISALLIFVAIAYAVTVLPRWQRKGGLAAQQAPVDTVPTLAVDHPLLGFLSNRVMISLMLFSSFPVAIAAVGFLNYFTPVYMNDIGASQSAIGQVLMLYGAGMVFIGPWAGRTMNTPERKRMAVFWGCLLSGAAFLSFGLFDGVLATAIAVFLLGVSHSVVLASQSAYALSLKATKYLGEGKAMGIFRSSGRIGQMLGPFVFGIAIAAADVERAVTIFGLVYIVTALLFLVCTIKDRRMLVAA